MKKKLSALTSGSVEVTSELNFSCNEDFDIQHIPVHNKNVIVSGWCIHKHDWPANMEDEAIYLEEMEN